MLWRSCIGPPSQPKLALSLPIKGPSFCRLTVLGGSENHTTAPAARWKCTPSVACGDVSPRGGEILAALHFEMLMRTKAESSANFPLRGKSRAAGIGVHFHERSEVVWFSFRYCHKFKLTPLLSIHCPTALAGGRWWRQPPKGACYRQAAFILAPTGRPPPPPQAAYILPSEPARSVGGT